MNDINHHEYCHHCIQAGGDEECGNCEHKISDGYHAAAVCRRKGNPYSCNLSGTGICKCKSHTEQA